MDPVSAAIALLGLAVGLAGATVGPVIGYLVAKRQIDHDRDLQRRDRHQRRLEDTYVDVLEYVLRVADSVDRTAPQWTFPGTPPPPAFPSDDEIRRWNARVGAFGTTAMHDRLLQLRADSAAFQAAVGTHHALTEPTSTANAQERLTAWEAVHEKRAAVRATAASITELANRELRE